MSMFAHLMNAPVSVRRLKGVSMTGDKEYSVPQVIRGRLEFQRRKVIDQKGEEAISEAVLWTQERLRTGDLVMYDGHEWPVISVHERKALYGATDHWEVRI